MSYTYHFFDINSPLSISAAGGKWEVIGDVKPYDDSGTQEEEELIPFKPSKPKPRPAAPPKHAVPSTVDFVFESCFVCLFLKISVSSVPFFLLTKLHVLKSLNHYRPFVNSAEDFRIFSSNFLVNEIAPT